MFDPRSNENVEASQSADRNSGAFHSTHLLHAPYARDGVEERWRLVPDGVAEGFGHAVDRVQHPVPERLVREIKIVDGDVLPDHLHDHVQPHGGGRIVVLDDPEGGADARPVVPLLQHRRRDAQTPLVERVGHRPRERRFERPRLLVRHGRDPFRCGVRGRVQVGPVGRPVERERDRSGPADRPGAGVAPGRGEAPPLPTLGGGGTVPVPARRAGERAVGVRLRPVEAAVEVLVFGVVGLELGAGAGNGRDASVADEGEGEEVRRREDGKPMPMPMPMDWGHRCRCIAFRFRLRCDTESVNKQSQQYPPFDDVLFLRDVFGLLRAAWPGIGPTYSPVAGPTKSC